MARIKDKRRLSWTQSEISLLAKLAPIHSAERIADELGRTTQSIRSKAKKLGIRLEKYGEYRHSAKFSKELVNRVIVLASQGYSCTEIEKETGISRFHVTNIRLGRSRWRETLCAD